MAELRRSFGDDPYRQARARRLGLVLAAAVEWSRATFPDRDVVAATLHLLREVGELGLAVAGDPSHATAEELADVVILAVAIADRAGVELDAAVAAKLGVLRGRSWARPDADGVVEHVRGANGG